MDVAEAKRGSKRMTELTQDLQWQDDALRLRATTELTPVDIGEAVGKHPATIRKLFARNPPPVAEPTFDRAMSAEEANEAFAERLEARHEAEAPLYERLAEQTTVYDHLPKRGDRLDEFRAEAGEAVGPMPPREMDGGEIVETEPYVRGSTQLALDFGPNAAEVYGATIVFKSDKLASGFFQMGDVVHFSGTARITAINGAEKFDKDLDTFVAKPQAQVATITEIEVA